ncbi:MAG: histidine phosphatase family protein, partial [Alphaproteobacteria bacterium]|nr:histidine phosphatase family protein [Alphaproteobacteria bacterium]
MTRIILVRHGLAAAGFAEALDPPLDEVGARQAADAARNLAGLGPVDLIASPMRRTRETAAPLA